MKRLDELRGHLLPSEFSATGEYSEKERDCARGYKVLAHAEIEAYLEDRAQSIMVKALKTWKEKGASSRTLLAMLVFWNANWKVGTEGGIGAEPGPDRSGLPNLTAGIEKAASGYFHRVKLNHGIGNKNLEQLLCPIGINLDELDPAWVASMDSFGRTRGLVAHSTGDTTLEIDPKDELQKVNQLLVGLAALDEKLSALEELI